MLGPNARGPQTTNAMQPGKRATSAGRELYRANQPKEPCNPSPRTLEGGGKEKTAGDKEGQGRQQGAMPGCRDMPGKEGPRGTVGAERQRQQREREDKVQGRGERERETAGPTSARKEEVPNGPRKGRGGQGTPRALQVQGGGRERNANRNSRGEEPQGKATRKEPQEPCRGVQGGGFLVLCREEGAPAGNRNGEGQGGSREVQGGPGGPPVPAPSGRGGGCREGGEGNGNRKGPPVRDLSNQSARLGGPVR